MEIENVICVFYPSIKKNMLFSGKYMEMSVIMLCQISQFHKDKYHSSCEFTGGGDKNGDTMRDIKEEVRIKRIMNI